MNKVLEIKNLYASYDGSEDEYILRDINLTLIQGEKIAIIGRSGSGKSTLLNSIIGSKRVERGSIQFNNKNVSSDDYSEIRASTLGVIYQDHYLMNDFTVNENIEIAQIVSNYTSSKERSELLNLVALPNKGNSMPLNLSGGEKQRVSIARALVNNPSVIIADEPTGNLDGELANEIVKIFKSLSASVIMVTHDKNLANKMDKIYELKNRTLNQIK
jgi:lipoprotein-releasing system ATP-binding protein